MKPCSTRKSKTEWWVITAVYVYKKPLARKREIIMCEGVTSTMIPEIFPDKSSAEEEIVNEYSDKRYWKRAKAVEITLAHTGN